MSKNKTLLVVDDEEAIRILLKAILVNGGYDVLLAKDSNEALEILTSSSNTISLILLDVMMSGVDGIALCQMIRREYRTPIVMLTALGDEESEKRGFEAGADDYVSKPIKSEALLARIARRLNSLHSDPVDQIIIYGSISINTKSHEVVVDGYALSLSPTEYNLILYLTQHPKEVIGRQQLLDEVWGNDYVGTLRTVDVHMARLRVKLLTKARYIQAVRGFGYLFEAIDVS